LYQSCSLVRKEPHHPWNKLHKEKPSFRISVCKKIYCICQHKSDNNNKELPFYLKIKNAIVKVTRKGWQSKNHCRNYKPWGWKNKYRATQCLLYCILQILASNANSSICIYTIIINQRIRTWGVQVWV
jgi:hypothetical protein